MIGRRYIYPSGTVRWFLWPACAGDVRGHRPPDGWQASAQILDIHPITGELLRAAQWWMKETKKRV